MKAYICGPTSGDFKLSMSSFRLNAEQFCDKISVDCIIPYDLFEGLSVNSTRDEFNIEIKELLTCQYIVMVGNWAVCEKCLLLKRIAQFLGIIVYREEQVALLKKA